MALFFKLLLLVATALPTVYSQDCDKKAVLDVVFAVDNTTSMRALIDRVREILPSLMDEFDKVYPGSRYGFYSVSDKDDSCKMMLASYEKGYCSRLELELTSDTDAAKNGLASVTAISNGYTMPEDSLGGLLVAAHNSDWRPFIEGQNILRTIILVTDAAYNQPGGPFHCKGPNFRPNDGDGTYDCANEDFPSVEQVKAVMSSKKILPIFLVANLHQSIYQTLLDQLDLGGLSEGISSRDTSIFEVIRNAVGSSVCATTTAPKTSAPTTPAPKTSAPTTPAPKTSAPTTPAPKTPAPTTPAPTTPAPTTPAPTTPAPKTSAPTTPVPKTTIKPTIPPTTSPGSKSTEAETTTTTAWIPGGGSGIIIIGAAAAAAVVVAGVAGGLYLRQIMGGSNPPAPLIDAQFDDGVHESENRDKEQTGLLDSSAYV